MNTNISYENEITEQMSRVACSFYKAMRDGNLDELQINWINMKMLRDMIISREPCLFEDKLDVMYEKLTSSIDKWTEKEIGIKFENNMSSHNLLQQLTNATNLQETDFWWRCKQVETVHVKVNNWKQNGTLANQYFVKI